MLSRIAGAVLLVTLGASSADAQLGKLKKLGEDAAKKAAEQKLGKKDTAATAAKGPAGSNATSNASANATTSAAASAEMKSAMLPLTAERVDIVLSAMTALADAAERETRDRALIAEFNKRDSVSKACINAASAGTPKPMSAAGQNAVVAMQKDLERISERYNVALVAQDPKGIYYEDSLRVLQGRMMSAGMGLSCKFEHAPTGLLQKRIATMGRSGDIEAPKTELPPTVRAKLTTAQFAMIRERIALFAISSADPAAKVGTEGVFTAEERAVLTARSATISRMTPFFRNGTLTWGRSSDLSGW